MSDVFIDLGVAQRQLQMAQDQFVAAGQAQEGDYQLLA